jgi:zinc protease
VSTLSITSLSNTGRVFAAALGLTGLMAIPSGSANATTIERVVSAGGIEAWVVRDPAVPMIAVDIAFRGGTDQDPKDRAGVATLAAGLWDEGAGDLDSSAFHDRLERKAIELSFRAGRDYVRGSLRTLSENRDEAFEYLRLSLTSPRFDQEPVERVRAQIMSRLRRETTSPNDIASNNWWQTAFPGHPYGRPVNGTLESVPGITVADMKTYTRNVLARDNIKIAIVGDIDLESVRRLLDKTFGGLPAKANLQVIADTKPQGLGRRIVTQLDVPQAVVNFGGQGIARNDPDFMAAYLVNHILGGGSFTSRLYREVREKRGLAYGVYDSLVWLKHTSVLLGGTATRAEATGETIEIIEAEIRRLAVEGPTAEEVADAKSYLKGSFALGLDTSGKIANQLVQMQIDNLGIDYIDKRPALIDAVSHADTKRVAKRLLDSGLLVTVVGRPKGVNSQERGG